MTEFQNVSFSYDGKKNVLNNVSFSLEDGEILAIMGESGCGKSTLLHLAAGLRKASEGKILSSHKKVAYAFQEPRLFPWLTVEENILAAMNGQDGQKNAERVKELLADLHLSDSANAYPDALSGGMKTRVSLARALAYDADLLLLDEPFSALNDGLRQELCAYLRQYIKSSGASAILVTHQRTDTDLMADRILEYPISK